MLTYNNVLIETGESGKVVYLPSYGWPAMDEAAVAAWQSIGFEPCRVEGLAISAMYGGGPSLRGESAGPLAADFQRRVAS